MPRHEKNSSDHSIGDYDAIIHLILDTSYTKSDLI